MNESRICDNCQHPVFALVETGRDLPSPEKRCYCMHRMARSGVTLAIQYARYCAECASYQYPHSHVPAHAREILSLHELLAVRHRASVQRDSMVERHGDSR
jgi:hypothetical protein